MRLLPRPEAVTGEVMCGHHKSKGNPDAWCTKPANHTGRCQLQVLEYTFGQWPNTQGSWSNTWGTDWMPRPSESAHSSSARRPNQAMFDYLRELMPEYNWDEEEARFKYDGGGFKGPPRASGQAEGRQERRQPEWDEFRDVFFHGWDLSARGEGDISSYVVEHPDQPGRMVEVSAEDFKEIAKLTGISGGYNGSDPRHASIVREVLSKYV